MTNLTAPFFIEVHSDCGHAFLPESYKDAGRALELAQSCQRKETDPTTSYLVSDGDQNIVWEGVPNT
jgi:hypothetical protein